MRYSLFGVGALAFVALSHATVYLLMYDTGGGVTAGSTGVPPALPAFGAVFVWLLTFASMLRATHPVFATALSAIGFLVLALASFTPLARDCITWGYDALRLALDRTNRAVLEQHDIQPPQVVGVKWGSFDQLPASVHETYLLYSKNKQERAGERADFLLLTRNGFRLSAVPYGSRCAIRQHHQLTDSYSVLRLDCP